MVSFSCNTPTAPGKYSKTIPLYGKLKPRKTKNAAAKAAVMNLFLINRFFAVFLKAIFVFLAFFHSCQKLVLDYPPERDEGNGQTESYHNGGFDGIGKTEIVEQNNGYSQETQNQIFFIFIFYITIISSSSSRLNLSLTFCLQRFINLTTSSALAPPKLTTYFP